MRFSRKTVLCVGTLAALMAFGSLLNRIDAGQNFPNQIGVSVGSTLNNTTFYTPGAQVPATIPIGVETHVSGIIGSVVMEDITSVEATLGGTLEVNGDDAVVLDPIQSEIPILHRATPLSGPTYINVFDGSLLDFVDISSGDTTIFAAEDMIRSIATADIYYNGATIEDTAFDEFDLVLELLDSATVDADGNMIPDASRLEALSTQIMDLDGNFSFVVDLGPPTRGFSTNEGSFVVLTESGPVEVAVRAPELEEIIAADPTTFGAMEIGRVAVTVSSDASLLLDTPAEANPLNQFDLEDDGAAAPAPRSLFVRTVLLLSEGARGSFPWTIVDTLPAPLEIEVEVSGRGVAALLSANIDVYGYEYALSVSQDGENMVADQNDAGWTFATVEIFNGLNGDDLESRGGTAPEFRDDTIVFRSSRATAIFGSNAMPELRASGGGGGGGCFIATAAYGTPLAAEIESLREVRDAYLIDTALGAAFVDAYYRVSPPMAGWVSESPAAKAVVRAALTPAIVVGGWMVTAPELVIAGVLLFLGAMVWSTARRTA